jgi:hypothetical protein
MNDMSLSVKAAVVSHLAGSAFVMGFVPSSRVYAMRSPPAPQRPFIRYGWSPVSSFEDNCGGGIESEVSVHCFSVDENEALRINGAIVQAMESFSPPFTLKSCIWQSSAVMPDSDGLDSWHGIVVFQITAVA